MVGFNMLAEKSIRFDRICKVYKMFINIHVRNGFSYYQDLENKRSLHASEISCMVSYRKILCLMLCGGIQRKRKPTLKILIFVEIREKSYRKIGVFMLQYHIQPSYCKSVQFCMLHIQVFISQYSS